MQSPQGCPSLGHGATESLRAPESPLRDFERNRPTGGHRRERTRARPWNPSTDESELLPDRESFVRVR